ncbi:hypothetical protein PENSPDRAFT_648705 [Peniophora sp. CONT]|nr:hypothetical protein PENSPDRAFT_648705 [Peniophora sp. CONT]
MSQQAPTTKVLQAPSSSYPITPSFIKVSNVLEGSLEDITQRLNIQHMRYERIQTSLRQLKTNLLNADQFAGGRYPLEEYRNDLTEALRENESMMEECKQAIASLELKQVVASLELKQVVAGLLEVKLEQLGIRPSSSDRDVAPYGGQPRSLSSAVKNARIIATV